jgi:hypothetical protein
MHLRNGLLHQTLVTLLSHQWLASIRSRSKPVKRQANNPFKQQTGDIFMKSKSITIAGSAFLMAAAFSTASAEPMKELDAYKGGLGKFSCDAKETGSGKTFKARVEKTVEFDGYTYVERYVEMKSADHPNPWNAIFIMSYDADSKQWVRNGVDNSGNRNAASSSGWNGDTWVWENDGVNIVIDKKGANGFTFAVDVKEAGGGVKRVAEALCKRT